jgi:hypothetical protein
VYNQTGVRIKYRPVEELRELIKGVDEAEARKEMERWKKDASQIIDVSDEIILRSSRMSLLISSLVRKEGLEGISVDCLSYSFSQDTSIPLPCLAFTRLRDQGISAACEADVCMMLSSMVMQDLTKRPSFQSNVSSLNIPDSSTVVRHCVVPTRIYGTEGPQVKYNLRDYHGMGKGAVPEIEFPEGLDVTMGGFTKDLKEFVLWPGRIKKTLYDMDTPSFPDAPPEFQKMRKYCSVKAEVKVKKIRQFAQNIAGVHHILVTGSHFEDIQNAMMRMNVRLVSPDDKVPPEV